MVALGGFNESALGYLRWGGFGSFLYSPTTSCLFLINTLIPRLLPVDLGPLPLLRPE